MELAPNLHNVQQLVTIFSWAIWFYLVTASVRGDSILTNRVRSADLVVGKVHLEMFLHLVLRVWLHMRLTCELSARVQEALIKEFEKTLQACLDEGSMKAFRECVDKYKVSTS